MTCKCGLPFIRCSGEFQTLVGYWSSDGHHHDDNCRSREFFCADGHMTKLSKRNRCPIEGCDWVGKDSCFCHEGKKLDEWPNAVLETCLPWKRPT